jgi:hypothetical protein
LTPTMRDFSLIFKMTSEQIALLYALFEPGIIDVEDMDLMELLMEHFVEERKFAVYLIFTILAEKRSMYKVSAADHKTAKENTAENNSTKKDEDDMVMNPRIEKVAEFFIEFFKLPPSLANFAQYMGQMPDKIRLLRALFTQDI